MAKEIGMAKGKGQDVAPLLEQADAHKALLEKSEQQHAALQQEVQEFLKRVPNIPHESVPVGASSEDNREERRWSPGDSGPRKFDFAVKDHVDIGERARRLDFDTAAKIAGRALRRDAAAASRGCTARSRSSCSTCTRASTATPRSTRRTW